MERDVWDEPQVTQRRFDAHITVARVPGIQSNGQADAEAKGAATDARATGTDAPAFLCLAKAVLRAHDRRQQWDGRATHIWWDATRGACRDGHAACAEGRSA